MFKDLFKSSNTEITFILNRLENQSARDYFGQEKFANFLSLIDGPKAAATKEYQKVTSAKLSECIVAVDIAKKLFYN